jgi:signal transduction histidine kinase
MYFGLLMCVNHVRQETPMPRHLASLRAWALGLTLLVAAGSMGVLAYQAVRLDRSHQAVASGVLRDYSAFAADQFSRLAVERLTALTRTLLDPVACGSSVSSRQAAALRRTAVPARAAESSCANPNAVDGFFEIDPTTGQSVFATGIADDLRDALDKLPMQGSMGFGLLSVDGQPRFIGYRSETAVGGRRRIVGLIAPASILRPVFDDLLRQERLLPGSLAEPAQNRKYLSVDVRDSLGHTLYGSGSAGTTFVAERAVGPSSTNMQLRLAINEGIANRLIIGGVPQSRVPLLLSLLAVAIGLLIVGAWQVQRERRMARTRVDFVRSASHELRTPLAQIRLFTETLQLGRVRSWAEVQQSLAFVDQQSRRLSRLVENLLTFANDGRHRRPNVTSIELDSFLRDVCRGFQPIADSLGQQIRVEDTEACVVYADREWLTQVMLNLLDNAAKYGPSGQTIVLRVDCEASRARILVEDQGPGIPSSDRERIFAPFVRLSREHEERTGGTGIGLAVAAELTAAMHGQIWADAAPQGARFIVALPVVEANEARPLVA